MLFLKSHRIFFLPPCHANRIKALLRAYYVCGRELSVDDNSGKMGGWEQGWGEAECKYSRTSHV